MLYLKFLYCMILADLSIANLFLFMPYVQPKKEMNLCTAVRVDEATYITAFLPDVENAHHMLIYGCDEPGSYEDYWECRSMVPNHNDPMEHQNHMGRKTQWKSKVKEARDGGMKNICKEGGNKIIYAWANNASDLRLPDGVAFAVGGTGAPRYLVLDAHYHRKLNFRDSSGVRMITTNTPTPKVAGIVTQLAYSRNIALGNSQLESSCSYQESKVLHPFAFRVHTHAHGVRVLGFRKRNGKRTLIGSRDPQLPQIFEPIERKLTIKANDILEIVCEMNNDDNYNLQIGPSADDEMCNFYTMYWVEGSSLPEMNFCLNVDEKKKMKKFMNDA